MCFLFLGNFFIQDDSYVYERIDRLSDEAYSSLGGDDIFKISVDLEDNDFNSVTRENIRVNEILPLWNLLPVDHGIMKITKNHQVYPNFPHVYVSMYIHRVCWVF